MDCLACGTPDTKIKDSMDKGTVIERKRTCACGAYFFSTETPDIKTLRVPGVTGIPARSSQDPAHPIKTQVNPSQVRPPPSQDSTPPADSGHGGVGGGLSSGSGSGPDSGSGTKGEDPNPWKTRGVWSPDIWNRKYGIAWTGKYQRYYGMSSDSKACGALGDLLERLPTADVLRAQENATRMFEAFLASDAPKVVKAKHPFAFFVTEFGGLRLEEPAPVSTAGGGYD